jgi:hypothetical protein
MTLQPEERRARAASERLGARARLSCWVSLAIIVVAHAFASSAAAESPRAAAPARLHLEYRREPAAATCLSAEQLALGVETRLGRPVFAPADSADLTARVSARRVARRFVIEVELYDRAQQSLGTRELSTRAPHCSSLDDSLALVLSLAADMPGVVAAPEASAPARAEASESHVPSTTVSPFSTPLSIPETTHAPRLGVLLSPSLGVAVDSGILPAAALGLELGLELKSNRLWPVQLRGAGWSEQRQALPGDAKGATFSAQTLELGVCPWTGRLAGREVSVCASQRLGRIAARGFGFDEPQRNDGWQVHVGVGAALKQEIGPLFVALSAGLLVPLVKRRYFFTDGVDVTLYDQPWLSGAAALRVGVEI